MRIIKKANDKITKLWGEGRILPTAYRLLTYTIPAETEDGILLQNAMTGELIRLDREEADKVSSLPCDYAPWMDDLIRKHFLVKVDVDDKKSVDTLRRALKISESSKNITDYTILPTTYCNARCFYCYETGRTQETMTDETADKLVDFMEAHRGGKPLRIGWFGGEPLVGVRQIDRISNALMERNVTFSASMISNGYLFDEATVKRAKENWKLKNIQITLDGTETVYNQTKAYVTPCESPFKKVLDNIGLLLQNEIQVSIRLNLGLHNADDLEMLVKELAMRFEDKSHLGAYACLLFDGCGMEPVHFRADELALLNEKKASLENLIRSFASDPVSGKLPRLIAHRCMADNTFSVTVLPSGKLGKCEHYTDSHYVGDLESGVTDGQELKCFAEPITFPVCAECPLYPSCIKLNLCETDRFCSQELSQADIRDTQRAMRDHYALFLRKTPAQEKENDENPNC